jgi:hypothetical protein
MDQPFEADVMDELGADLGFNPADDAFDETSDFAEDGFEDSADEYSEGLSDLGMDGFEEEESFEEGSFDENLTDNFSDNFSDDFSGEVGEAFWEEGDATAAVDALEAAVADALDAEDADEFFRRLARGVRRATQVARQVGRTVGQVARTVAPIASAIPLPQAQAIGRIAGLAGRLLAEGADEFEVLDEMFAFSDSNNNIDAALPVIAGLTIRTVMPQARRLPRPARRQLVRSVTQATRVITRRQGPQAARAIPRVVQAVQRTAQRRRVPARQLPQAVRQAAARVARDPRLVRRLAASQPISSTQGRGRQPLARTGVPQRLVIRGPVEITIQSR